MLLHYSMMEIMRMGTMIFFSNKRVSRFIYCSTKLENRHFHDLVQFHDLALSWMMFRMKVESELTQEQRSELDISRSFKCLKQSHVLSLGKSLKKHNKK